MIAVNLTVHGRVQGVFYRDWTVRNARELGLAGWVRNRPDGTVEALLQGDETAVRRMVGLMRSGPPRAHVTRIEEQACEAQETAVFSRR
jgi:acylphosphatase